MTIELGGAYRVNSSDKQRSNKGNKVQNNGKMTVLRYQLNEPTALEALVDNAISVKDPVVLAHVHDTLCDIILHKENPKARGMLSRVKVVLKSLKDENKFVHIEQNIVNNSGEVKHD